MNYIYFLIALLYLIARNVYNWLYPDPKKNPPKNLIGMISSFILGIIGMAVLIWPWIPLPRYKWFPFIVDIVKSYPSFITDIIFGNINDKDTSREWYEKLILRYYHIMFTIIIIGVIITFIGWSFKLTTFDKGLKMVIKIATGIRSE